MGPAPDTDNDFLVLGTATVARLGMGIPALMFVLNQSNISFLAMAISYTVIMTFLYVVLLLRYWQRTGQHAMSKTQRVQLNKASGSMVAVMFWDYVFFMAWMWAWLSRHGSYRSLSADAPTPADNEFSSAQFMMNTFVLFGLLYFGVVFNYVMHRYNLDAQDAGLSKRSQLRVENFSMRSNGLFMTYMILSASMWVLSAAYSLLMMLVAATVNVGADTYDYIWIMGAITVLLVLSTGFFTLYSYNRTGDDMAFLSFWSDLITPKLTMVLWIGVNWIWYINALTNSTYKDELGDQPKFDGSLGAQTQFYVAWQPFAVFNAIMLAYHIGKLVSLWSVGSDVRAGRAFSSKEMTVDDWSAITPDVRSGWAVSLLRFFIGVSVAYSIVHMMFLFVANLEVRYLNTRLKGWAIAYTILGGIPIAYVALSFLMRVITSGTEFGYTPRTRLAGLKIFFVLMTAYFQGIFMYWFTFNKFDGDMNDPLVLKSLSDANIKDSSTQVSFAWSNLINTVFGVWYIVLITLGEGWSGSNLLEIGAEMDNDEGVVGDATHLLGAVGMAVSDMAASGLGAAADVTEESADFAEGAATGSVTAASNATRRGAEYTSSVVAAATGTSARIQD